MTIIKPLPLIVLLLQCALILGHAKGSYGRVTYQDLVNLNANCSSYEFCYEKRDNNRRSDCNCGTSCVQLGICCVDSSNRWIPTPKIRPTCRALGPVQSGFWMVDQCPELSDGTNSIYEDLCREEWNGQNDIMRLVPVTSLFTHITYKNYFCLRCHESSDDHVFWTVSVKFEGQTDVEVEKENIHLDYDHFYKTWVATAGLGGNYFPVSLDFAAPASTVPVTKVCNPSLISDCPEDWQDNEIRAKCYAYMHVTSIARDNLTLKYRNPHCALCNFESLNNFYCEPQVSTAYGFDADKKPFSFTFLLDINRSDGDKVGQVQRCKGNDVWDPFFKECRTLTCALPLYTVQEGKCIPP